jgi:hypothetical protein
VAYAVAVTNVRLTLKTSARSATRKGDDDPIELGVLSIFCSATWRLASLLQPFLGGSSLNFGPLARLAFFLGSSF